MFIVERGTFNELFVTLKDEYDFSLYYDDLKEGVFKSIEMGKKCYCIEKAGDTTYYLEPEKALEDMAEYGYAGFNMVEIVHIKDKFVCTVF